MITDITQSEFVHFHVIPGGTLEDFIQDQIKPVNRYTFFGSLAPHELCTQVYHYMVQILHGLAYLHENSRIHTDLKPSNILLSSDKMLLKIGDFDDSVKLKQSHTMTDDVSAVKGTFLYMSPEMVLNESSRRRSTVGRKTDLWSLGCILLRMLTGKNPRYVAADGKSQKFTSVSELIVYFDSDSAEPPEIPKFRVKRLERIISRCLRIEAEDRLDAKSLLAIEEFGAVSRTSK